MSNQSPETLYRKFEILRVLDYCHPEPLWASEIFPGAVNRDHARYMNWHRALSGLVKIGAVSNDFSTKLYSVTHKGVLLLNSLKQINIQGMYR